MNYTKTCNNKIYLTLLGGEAFENQINWIIDALHRSLKLYKSAALDLIIVSYGYSNKYVQ